MPTRLHRAGRCLKLLAAFALGTPLALMLVPGGISADGGDFRLDFIAAAPETYLHQGPNEGSETRSGALQFDGRAINTHVRESLEAEEFACGDRVIFFTQVTVDDRASGAQSIDLHYEFDAENNGQKGAGYREVVAAGLSAEDFLGQDQETGHNRSGNERVSLVSQSYGPSGNAPPEGFGTGAAETLLFTVRLTGLDAGEVVIVRADVRFGCFASNPTGNVHAAIASAQVVAGGEGGINVGRQEIPMLGVQELQPPPAVEPPASPALPAPPGQDVVIPPEEGLPGPPVRDVPVAPGGDVPQPPGAEGPAAPPPAPESVSDEPEAAPVSEVSPAVQEPAVGPAALPKAGGGWRQDVGDWAAAAGITLTAIAGSLTLLALRLREY